jgi:choline dehydrogenase-like flavoprotein
MTTYEGVALGGRTRINAGLYLQGCPEEYNSWGDGWRWDDVAPFFARFERRQELENDRTHVQEGGEWKTRIVKAEYESSRQ